MILPWKNHHKTIKTHEYFPINTTIHRDCTAMFDSRMVPPVKSVALATKEANYLHGLPAKKLGMFCTHIPTIWILSMPQLGDIEVRKRPGEWTSAWWYYRSCQVSIWAVVRLVYSVTRCFKTQERDSFSTCIWKNFSQDPMDFWHPFLGAYVISVGGQAGDPSHPCWCKHPELIYSHSGWVKFAHM